MKKTLLMLTAAFLVMGAISSCNKNKVSTEEAPVVDTVAVDSVMVDSLIA